MGLNLRDAKNTSGIPTLEAGTYAAVCCGVIDLGLQKVLFRGSERESKQILLIWELPDETVETDKGTIPRRITKTYTFSVNEKSNLRTDLKNWRGRDFTAEELEDFDIANMLNAPCTITVSRTEKGGIPYANVSSVGKAMKGPAIAEPAGYYYFDIDNMETWVLFYELPEWIQRKINGSLTLKDRGIQIDASSGRPVSTGKPENVPDGGYSYICGDASGEDLADEDLPF